MQHKTIDRIRNKHYIYIVGKSDNIKRCNNSKAGIYMYVVDYVGQITKYYGDKLKYMQSLGMFTTDNYLIAVNYSNAVKVRNNRI